MGVGRRGFHPKRCCDAPWRATPARSESSWGGLRWRALRGVRAPPPRAAHRTRRTLRSTRSAQWGGDFGEGASLPASGSVRVAEAGAPASGSELPSTCAQGCASRCASRRASRCASRCALRCASMCASRCASGSACKTHNGRCKQCGARCNTAPGAGAGTHQSPRRLDHLISCQPAGTKSVVPPSALSCSGGAWRARAAVRWWLTFCGTRSGGRSGEPRRVRGVRSCTTACRQVPHGQDTSGAARGLLYFHALLHA